MQQKKFSGCNASAVQYITTTLASAVFSNCVVGIRDLVALLFPFLLSLLHFTKLDGCGRSTYSYVCINFYFLDSVSGGLFHRNVIGSKRVSCLQYSYFHVGRYHMVFVYDSRDKLCTALDTTEDRSCPDGLVCLRRKVTKYRSICALQLGLPYYSYEVLRKVMKPGGRP